MEPYNVSVDDERCHLGDVDPRKDLWENHVFLVRGRTATGEDVTLFTGCYVIKQGADSYYVFDGNVHQTTLMHGRYSRAEKQQMNDNDFVTTGWQPSEHLPPGSIEVRETDGGVVWKAGDRVCEDTPPTWCLRGRHGGIDLDLALEAHVPAFWLYPFDGLAETGAGWYEAYLRARGRIGIGGRDLDVAGYACHERVLLTREHEPHRLMGRGLYWQHLFDDRVQCWMMASPSAGEAVAHLVVDGETYAADGQESVSVEDLASWTDPRSWLRVPVCWRIRVVTEAGELDVVARAFARAYYLRNEIKEAVHILYWFTSEANGSFTRTDGTVIPVVDAPYVAHSNRVLFETARP